MKKTKGVFITALAVGLLFLSAGNSTFAETSNMTGLSDQETDQVIVTFKEGEETGALLEQLDVTELETDPTVTIKVPEEEELEQFMKELEEKDEVESVEPDYLIELYYTPNDPHIFTRQYHLQKIGANRAWFLTRGSPNVIVAVLDNGVDVNHIDLKGRLVAPYDIVAKSSTKIVNGEHGTHVTGIIGSSINNGVLGAGVAPGVSIMPINIFNGPFAYTSDVVKALDHAVRGGAKVINLSIGNYQFSNAFNDAVQKAYNSGAIVVAAAGNESTDRPHYPAAYDNVISVGSTTATDKRSSFSNFGRHIDLTAPGSDIYSTLPGDGFGPMSGTSMAAPIVSGVAALVWSQEPALSNREVIARLFSSADDLGTAGKDIYFGHGRINAKNALNIPKIAVPQVDRLTDQSSALTGTVPYEISNATVTVTNQRGKVITSKGGINGMVKFTVPIPLQSGGTVLYVTVSGTDGSESAKVKITVADVTPPAMPTVNVVADNAVSISGKAEAGARVYAAVGTRVIGEAVAANGSYTIPIAKQKAGTGIVIYAVDAAGNKSASRTVKVIDKTPPGLPSVNAVHDNATVVSGKAEVNSKVYVLAAGKLIGETTAAKGSYSLNIPKQKAGTAIAVYAVDAAGNKGNSRTVKVIDKTPPPVPTVNAIHDNALAITGKAENRAKVFAYAGTRKIGEAIAVNGVFSIQTVKLKAGTVVTVHAVDAANNKSANRTVRVIDKTPPAAPTVYRVTNNSVFVSGKSERGATVYVYSGTNKLGQVAVDSNGNYKMKIKAPKTGELLRIHAQDAAGNKSKHRFVRVAQAGTAKAVIDYRNLIYLLFKPSL
ncbi:MAG TPA: Ig-like domain-containing protein [Planococcus sp. (in: firmicutes)]|nr:Ig-like domain-containing protein [Planococcus sp. (in: firmicutes)]